MAKLQIVLLFALAACLLVQADAQQCTRSARLRQQRNRQLARQELEDAAAAAGADGAPAAVTPYPSADELKPEIPFEEAAPVEPTPDEVYGPPELTYSNGGGVPDEVYGPPDFSDNGLAGADAVEPFPPTLEGEQARLVAQRRANLRQRQQAAYRQAVAKGRAAGRPAKLRGAIAPKRFA